MQAQENNIDRALVRARRRLAAFWTMYRWAILSGMAIGLIAYMFTFTNKLPNHDDVTSLFIKGSTISSGRWGLELLRLIIPDYSMPWLFGVITLMCVSVSAALVAYRFNFRGRLQQVLTGGLFAVFPSLTGTFSYMFTSSAYGIAILLAVLAFVLVTRERNRLAGTAVGSLLMILSLGIYQAYISLTVSLLVIYLIQRLLKNDMSAKEIVLTGIRYICFALASLILYYVITRLVLAIAGTGLNGYASSSICFLRKSLLQCIMDVFRKPLGILLHGNYGITTNIVSRICHILCVLLTAAMAVCWFFGKESRGRRWLMPLLMLALLFSLNMLYFIISSGSIHTLVLYGYVSVYVLFFVFVNDNPYIGNPRPRRITKSVRRVMYVLMLFILTCNVYLANEASLLQFIEYENQYADFSSIITRIESNPAFKPGTKIAIIDVDYITRHDISNHFLEAREITGTSALGYQFYSREQFMYYYLNFDGEFASEEEKEILKATPEFAEMQVYPYYDSIRVIDGYIVVKY